MPPEILENLSERMPVLLHNFFRSHCDAHAGSWQKNGAPGKKSTECNRPGLDHNQELKRV